MIRLRRNSMIQARFLLSSNARCSVKAVVFAKYIDNSYYSPKTKEQNSMLWVIVRPPKMYKAHVVYLAKGAAMKEEF